MFIYKTVPIDKFVNRSFFPESMSFSIIEKDLIIAVSSAVLLDCLPSTLYDSLRGVI